MDNPVAPTVSCPNCGAAAPASQRFCGECGKSLRVKCPACGAENAPTFRFCGNCGSGLETPAAAPQPAAAGPAPRPELEERRWVTVLFADLSGFTAMSEGMDPEDVKDFADRCARRMSDKVRQFGGTVLRVLGDEVLAVFGAPAAHEDDAERAVRAALAMTSQNLSGDPERPVQVHVGVNTGQVMAGLMGPDENRDYTVMGDIVNTAARLRSLAPGGSIWVGENTYRVTRGVVSYRELPPVAAKGKDQPVRAWEVLQVAPVPQPRPLGTAPLIGRGGELERLEAMAQRVLRDRQPHLFTLSGEPGIGKSRLVAELLSRLPANVRTWHGRCLPYGEALGYSALAAILKDAVRVTAEDNAEQARSRLQRFATGILGPSEGADEIARHLALLAGLDLPADRADPGPHGEAGPDQHALHASVRRFVEAYAQQTPLCVVVDDLQWADDSLLDLLEAIAARVREAPVLLVTMARPELAARRPAWGGSLPSFTAFTLQPLDAECEHELISALAHERGLAAEFIEKIGRSAGGNPLFAEEMVAMIAEAGPGGGVPSVIKMLISTRLDALPPDERLVGQLAAVFGKAFWPGGVRALRPALSERLPALLEALERKDLVREAPRSELRGERQYTFKHDLIREVAYEVLPRAKRRSLHGRALAWLEQAAGEMADAFLDQLARHAVEAGQLAQAIDYLARAAERANRAAAHREAAALLGQAISLATNLGQPGQVAELRILRGRALMSVGLWTEAQPEFEAVLQALPLDQVEQRAQVLVYLGEAQVFLLDVERLRHYARQAQAAAEAAGRADLAASGIGMLALAESLEGNLEASVRLSQQVAARLETGRASHIAGGLDIQSLNMYWLGRYAEAVSLARQAVAAAGGDTPGTIDNLPNLGLAYAGSGQYAEAEQAFAEARRFGREYETWPMLARAIAMSAGWRLSVYDWQTHEAIAEEARELARSVDFVPPQVSAGIDLVLNYARRGEVARAERLLPEIEAGRERAGAWHRWLWRLRTAQARAELALARGEWEAALALADASLEESQAHGRVKYQALGLEARAKALVSLGRTHEAIEDLRQAVALARPTGDPAMLLRAGAALLAVDGDDDLAREVRAAAEQIRAALPDEAARRAFEAAEPVRLGFRV